MTKCFSVLGPLLFIMTLPPQYSHLLSFPEPLSLCRRHPTIFLILPAQLQLKHYQLQNANQQISSCMTANPLTINSSTPRLNFYSLDSKSNLTRDTTPHLTPPNLLATNLGFILNEDLTVSTTNTRPSPKLAITILAASLYPSLPWFHHSLQHCHLLVHCKLDYCNPVYYKLPKSQITRL